MAKLIEPQSLHTEILSRCRKLFESGDYAEAVDGRGRLYVEGAAARHVDEDFQNGVKFLTMAIDRFRNEKSHTADGNITDPIRAYEYLTLSSLALHLLDRARLP